MSDFTEESSFEALTTPTPTLMTTTSSPSSSSLSEWSEVITMAKLMIEGIGILGFGMVGLFINAFALYVLFRKRVLRNFHLLMCTLAVYDFLHLVCGLLCFALPQLSTRYKRSFFIPAIPILIPFTQIALTSSCYTTVAITVERFFSIRKPFFIQRHNIKARMFIVPVLIYALLFNVPRFFEFRVESDEESHEYRLHLTDVRKNKLYISIYVNTLSFLSNLVVPFITMGLLNYAIYNVMHVNPHVMSGAAKGCERRALRRSCENVLRKREARITRASIAITLMFVACHWPRCIPNLLEMFIQPADFPWWLPVLVSSNHLLITINSAFNFLFYLSYCRATARPRNRAPSAPMGGSLTTNANVLATHGNNPGNNVSASQWFCLRYDKRYSEDVTSSVTSAFNEAGLGNGGHHQQRLVHFEHPR